MKKILILITILFSFNFLIIGQTIVYEKDFNEYSNYCHFPYDGWTEEGFEDYALWQFTGTNNYSGGDGSFLLHYGYGSNQFTGMTRAVSPIIDLSGYTVLQFNFLYGGRQWTDGFTIGMATRSGGGDWHTIYSYENTEVISGETGSTEVFQIVNNSDIGQSDVQICFFFDGTNHDCKYLCFDEFKITELIAHDIYTKEVTSTEQAVAGSDFNVEAEFYNAGTDTEDFDAILKVYNNAGTLIYTDTKPISNLAASEIVTINFDPYIVADNDEIFSFEVTHNLATDENNTNDIKEGIFNSYTTERQKVLLEIATATWCGGCPGVALAVDDFVSNGDMVIPVEYHANDDYAIDGLVTERFGANMYGSYALPTSVFDGKYVHVGGNANQSVYDDLLPYYQQRIAYNSPIHMTFSANQISTTEYDATVDIEKFAPLYDDDYKILIVLTESKIEHDWGGQTELNYVVRDIWPNFTGRNIDLYNNSNISEDFSISFDNVDEIENCELVAFVQDYTTLEVLQAIAIPLPDANQAPNVTFNVDNNATDIPVNTIFKIYFDQEVRNIDDSEITNSDLQDLITFNTSSKEAVDFTAEINDSKTIITITPNDNLSYETTCVITIQDVESLNNIPIEISSVSFTTEILEKINAIITNEINIFPNPSNGIIQISSNNDFSSVTIINIFGKIVYQTENDNDKTEIIDISGINAGIYIVQIKSNNNNIAYKKLIIH